LQTEQAKCLICHVVGVDDDDDIHVIKKMFQTEQAELNGTII
jgi:hypothetical protein